MVTRLLGLVALLSHGACAVDGEPVDGEDDTASATLASTTQCSGGQMCFWDDDAFTDSFRSLTASHSNFNSLGFGDKTTSVLNLSSVAWVLFDDAGFSDTAVCVMAGASVADLGHFGFNDKVSSAQRRSANTCPSGLVVFTGAN